MSQSAGFNNQVERAMMHALRSCNGVTVFKSKVTQAMCNATIEVRREASRRLLEEQLILRRPANNKRGPKAEEMEASNKGRQRLAELEAVYATTGIWG